MCDKQWVSGKAVYQNRPGPSKPDRQQRSDGGTWAQKRKSCSFSQTPCREKKPDNKRGSVLGAISAKSPSQDRSTESRSEMERGEEKRELYLVNNFHESAWGKNVCNLAVCFRILNMLGLLHHTSKDQREGDGRETRRRENHGFWWARLWATSSASHGGKNISAISVTVLQSTSTNSYCKVFGERIMMLGRGSQLFVTFFGRSTKCQTSSLSSFLHQHHHYCCDRRARIIFTVWSHVTHTALLLSQSLSLRLRSALLFHMFF